ncbi:MAG: DEAD/DEAH box helicase family protein, partial [Deltaproteobacteria bacterium]|nr:DEAD/DEAH box helicase family protein [Deltaproteobacteria bacterium]
MRKSISKAEREAVYVVADGKCEITGEELKQGFHIDHIKPVAAGGANDVSNYQAATPEANLKKSSKYVKPFALRDWQERLQVDFEKKRKSRYLVNAIPGTGKTFAALNLVKRHLKEFPDAKVVVVVPTINLKTQWRDAARDKFFNIEFHTSEFYGAIKDGFQGVCVTYQEVGSKGSGHVFKRLCSKYSPLFVIFDEVHHVGDQLSWGSAVINSFEDADKKLLMTGTPFRSDSYKIPFVDYVDDLCRPDFSYDYPEAIRDGCLRIINFDFYDGNFEWRYKDKFESATFTDTVSEEIAKQRLKASIDIGSAWLKTIIVKADEHLGQIRQTHSDAGGLIIASNQFHAKVIAAYMRETLHEDPVVVVSEEKD